MVHFVATIQRIAVQRIGCVGELWERAQRSRRHGALVMHTAEKLGGQPNNFREAQEWLVLIASTEGE